MKIDRLNHEQIERVKFYSPKGCHPRLAVGSQMVYILCSKEMQAAATVKDIERLRKAKSILYYCLN